jgi:hypothetical protein
VRRWHFVVAGIAVGAAVGIYVARTRREPSKTTSPTSARELRVPKLAAPIALDGETDDPGWRQVARTGTFLTEAGEPARPYSDARFVWGDGKLWVLLYAADEDIRSTDSFHLDIASHSFDVSPLGKVTLDGALSAHDLDGTLDDPKDDDEEWVLELAIPLAALGVEPKSGARLPIAIHRCDTPKGSAKTCAQWGEQRPAVLVLD